MGTEISGCAHGIAVALAREIGIVPGEKRLIAVAVWNDYTAIAVGGDTNVAIHNRRLATHGDGAEIIGDEVGRPHMIANEPGVFALEIDGGAAERLGAPQMAVTGGFKNNLTLVYPCRVEGLHRGTFRSSIADGGFLEGEIAVVGAAALVIIELAALSSVVCSETRSIFIAQRDGAVAEWAHQHTHGTGGIGGAVYTPSVAVG